MHAALKLWLKSFTNESIMKANRDIRFLGTYLKSINTLASGT